MLLLQMTSEILKMNLSTKIQQCAVKSEIQIKCVEFDKKMSCKIYWASFCPKNASKSKMSDNNAEASK